MLPSEALWQAKAHLEKGWCKGKLQDHTGKVCLIGALNTAVYGTAFHAGLLSNPPLAEQRETHRVCRDTLQKLLGVVGRGMPSGSIIVSFNNHPNTTKDDVLTLVKKAAIALEEQGR